MSYPATRRLVVAGGLAVLVLVALVLFVRRVDTIEVVAVLLFVPVFLAFVTWNLAGGVLAGLLASCAYAALRLEAVDAVGVDRFTGLIATRTLGYLAFGALGGWAAMQLERSLEKLDIYDQIDDSTGLFNARFFLQETELELARAERYKTLFSVVVVDLPRAGFDALGRRRRAALLTDLGRVLRDAVRNVDRAVHAATADAYRLAVICPETGKEGAAVFEARLVDQLVDFLAGRGATIERDRVEARALTLPGDDHELARLRGEFERIEQDEHPENAATA